MTKKAPKTSEKNLPSSEPKRLNVFERYLTVWVLVCMVIGVALGKLLPDVIATLSAMEFGKGSQVNVPIAIFIWLMIFSIFSRFSFISRGV